MNYETKVLAAMLSALVVTIAISGWYSLSTAYSQRNDRPLVADGGVWSWK